jgi:hypothetical protein
MRNILLNTTTEVVLRTTRNSNVKCNKRQCAPDPTTKKIGDTHALKLILHQAIPGAERTAIVKTSSTRPVIVAYDGPQAPVSPRRRHHAIDSRIGAATEEPSFWTAGDVSRICSSNTYCRQGQVFYCPNRVRCKLTVTIAPWRHYARHDIHVETFQLYI